MAKLRMTYKTLKALRKSREYQALLIDLVNESVVSKAVAESLLGYNIPSDLLPKISSAEQTEVPVNGEEGQGSGGESQGSGGESTETDTVTLLYFNATANDNAGEWETETFTLANDTTEADIIAAAKTAFEDNTIDAISFVEQNAEYVEGTSELTAKYTDLDPQPEAFEDGQLIGCFKAPESVVEEQGSGNEASGITISLIYFDETANDNAGAWLTHDYTPTSTDVSEEGDAIIAAAKTAFSDNTINALTFAELNNEYVEGTSDIELKYLGIKSGNWPTTFTNGDLIVCYNASSGNKD